MSKPLILLAAASVTALAFPSAFDEYRKRLSTESGVERLEAPPTAAIKASAPTAGIGRASLVAGPDGHFRTQARFNGRPVDVLVDTGATYVSMNETNARRLGVAVKPGDFRYSTKTANGEVPVAIAKLDRVQVGNVDVRDVDVAVTKGDGLDTVLLGMSFLAKLSRYGVADGKLDLTR
ncbi:retropepsin-like aspartic protease family protein [Aureimonas psammosilenae]|uniref:retropepsin-like aspartic protease family protein n=1 Tax=Aureimonas psammosilenae TaxID=2495496 RepID=UPI00186A3C47|nr:TIGR02281 family clan AA aspartic protease [Aureimonas psammosilenae]